MHATHRIGASIGLLAALLAASAALARESATSDAVGGDPRSRQPPAATDGTGMFRSGMERYRPYRADEPLLDWRRANDEARRLGGHGGQMAAPAAGAAATPHGGR